MYIAVCDDQIEELEKLTALLQAWQSDRRSDVRFQTFRSGGQLLDAAHSPFGVALTREQCIQHALMHISVTGSAGRTAQFNDVARATDFFADALGQGLS